MSASKLTVVSAKKLDDALASRGHIDCFIFNSYQMAAAFPHFLEKPFGFVAHNVEHLSARQNAKSASSRLQRWLYGRDEKLLKKIEMELCDRAEYVWTLSQDDLELLNISKNAGAVLPLVAPFQEVDAKRGSKDHDVGLIGTWSWEPNRVGLEWFLDHVAPKLSDDVRIAVAGKVPEGMMKYDERISFLGRVESATEFLDSVRVVPLISRGGTGVQLKTIEAFQAGLACVATSSSLRGIDMLPDNCARADDVEEFASALTQQIDKSRNGILPLSDGRQFYEKQFCSMQDALVKGLKTLT